MNHNLVEKYFNDRCSEEEVEEVLNWFRTREGQAFLDQQMNEEFSRVMNAGEPDEHPRIESEKVFSRIQRSKQQHFKKGGWFAARVASIVLIATLFSSFFYWGDVISLNKKSSEPVAYTYAAQAHQQKIVTLSDGTVIRLNEGAVLTVPKALRGGERQVELQGEAYFEVTHDPAHPFIVRTPGSTVEVLGTKFNVNAPSAANRVQVAVVEGKVSLKSSRADNTASAVLTKNNLGLLRLSDSQITIEKVNTQNYLSWITNRLVFTGESLQQVSRQLERLYDVKVVFATAGLKKLKLTADFERNDLETTIATIANTFDIRYHINGEKVTWMEQERGFELAK